MIEAERAVNAAIGYLNLGMAEEAWEELDSLPPDLIHAWPVVEARIGIFQVLDKWKDARELAESMARRFPEEPAWWLKWAYSLRHESSASEARSVLWEAVQLHPSVAMISYHLACYACALGDKAEAGDRLRRALAIDPRLRATALDDSDLALLWKDGVSP